MTQIFLSNGEPILSPYLGGGWEENGVSVSPPVTDSATGQVVHQPAQQGAPPAQGGGGFFGGLDGVAMLLIYAAIFAAFYFLAIRPQRKRDKKMKEMQAELKVGDNIVTTGGLFGRIADVGHDCFVVEFGTNRGVRIPIRKTDVLGIQTPQMTAPKTEE